MADWTRELPAAPGIFDHRNLENAGGRASIRERVVFVGYVNWPEDPKLGHGTKPMPLGSGKLRACRIEHPMTTDSLTVQEWSGEWRRTAGVPAAPDWRDSPETGEKLDRAIAAVEARTVGVDACPDCGTPMSEHDFGVPKPPCPVGVTLPQASQASSLPPLPAPSAEAWGNSQDARFDAYTAEQMRDYARSALAGVKASEHVCSMNVLMDGSCGVCGKQVWDKRADGVKERPALPTTEELEDLWQTTHYGHPADFAADVLERWGCWMPGLLGHGGALQEAIKIQAQRNAGVPPSEHQASAPSHADAPKEPR